MCVCVWQGMLPPNEIGFEIPDADTGVPRLSSAAAELLGSACESIATTTSRSPPQLGTSLQFGSPLATTGAVNGGASYGCRHSSALPDGYRTAASPQGVDFRTITVKRNATGKFLVQLIRKHADDGPTLVVGNIGASDVPDERHLLRKGDLVHEVNSEDVSERDLASLVSADTQQMILTIERPPVESCSRNGRERLSRHI